MRLFDLIHNQLQDCPVPDAFAHKIQGKWKKYSTSDTVRIVNQLSIGLIESGISAGDKIAIISEGRPEWVFVDLACQQIGAVLVPLYPTLGKKDYETILKESEVSVIFVSNSTTLKTVQEAATDLGIKKIYTFNKIPNIKSWLEVLRSGKGQKKEKLKERMDAVKSDDLCTIIYTSGTSGAPKGVMLSHNNIVSNVKEASKVSTLDKGKDRALSFLPLNHIYEKTGIYTFIFNSIAIYFAESMETIGDDLREVRPHTFNAVPRLLEKVYEKIVTKGEDLSSVKKGIFKWAIALGLKYDPSVSPGSMYNRQLAVANKLVFNKWREALGGNIKQIQCGASALQPRLARIFWAAGIKVLEGYGLTETSPVIAANNTKEFRAGSVGKILKNLEVRLSEENEIMVKGPSVMIGYFKNEKLTREVLDEDGWFKTGDIGRIEDDFLFITDRKKELFKTSGGMYVAPQQIENRLKESVYIEQAMVIGEGEKFPAVLIVPNFDVLLKEAGQRFLMIDTSDLLRREFFRKIFQEELNKLNEELGSWTRIKGFRIIDEEWTPESGELTPTLKLKRSVILEKYQSKVDEIYGRTESDVFDEYDSIDLNEVNLGELEEMESL
ncbi:MAG: long-chain fatty acid--CoA ligase [Cyclobacteriaceae bacterium]